MSISLRFGLILLALALGLGAPAGACTLTMGYKGDAKLPFIAAAPDSSGVYFDLYTRAAERLGCRLEVRREPKRRIHEWMKEGRVDFYPGMKFSEERAEFAQFIENGLPGGRAGVSMEKLPEIRGLEGLRGVRVVAGLGGVDYLSGIEGVAVERVPDLGIDKAITLVRRGRVQFYSTDILPIQHYLRSKGITDMRVHPDCCGGVKPLQLGFSRASPHFRGEPNPAFDPLRKVDAENQPLRPAPESMAWRLGEVLRALREEGVTGELLDRHLAGISLDGIGTDGE